MFRIFSLLLVFLGFWATIGAAQTAPAPALIPQESSFWQNEVTSGDMPPVQDRLPRDPLIVDLEAKGRTFGTQGGTLRTLVSRSKDVRQMVVYGYARLVGYDQNYELYPDILRDIEVHEGRKFTLHLRRGHKWSDGHPFTSADFRYFWENVALNEELSPSGPSQNLIIDGVLANVSFPDDHTVIFEWPTPNPQFLQLLAQASPFLIYRPAHYLKQFHADFTGQKRPAPRHQESARAHMGRPAQRQKTTCTNSTTPTSRRCNRG